MPPSSTPIFHPPHRMRLRPARLPLLAGLVLTLILTGGARVAAGEQLDNRSAPVQPTVYIEGGPLHWSPCFNSTEPSQARFRCGWLDVPLDHTDQSDSRTVRIAMVLLQVGKSKSDRTVMYNPGGPGESATGDLFEVSDLLLEYTAGTMDILAFDPRGVNMTTPQMSCYHDDDFRAFQYFPTLPTREVPDPVAQLWSADHANKDLMRACRDRLGDLPRFMSTVAVAKDMELIRQAFGEPETNAIFISYGTDLYITYSQLFPSAVGRVVLQAIVDQPHQATLDDFGLEEIASKPDIVYHGFFVNCVRVGPPRCPFADAVTDIPRADKVQALNHTFWRLIDELGRSPMEAVSPVYGLVSITPAVFLGAVVDNIWHISDFTLLGSILGDLATGNTSSIMTGYIEPLYSTYTDGNPGVRGWPGVRAPKQVGIDAGTMTICADAAQHIERDFGWWNGLSIAMSKVSRIGAAITFSNIFPCRHFDWNVTEELTGPLNATLKNPVLLVASTYDPATPYFSAERMARAMGRQNARLVEVHGFGHGAQLPSACLMRIVRAVFVNGTLPSAAHTRCQPDELPFGP
ncbi:hypothetical protein V8E36_002519 [Tilletia maclaganii]